MNKNFLLLTLLTASCGSVVNLWCGTPNNIGLPRKQLTPAECMQKAAQARDAASNVLCKGKCSICLGFLDDDDTRNVVTLECALRSKGKAQDHSFHTNCITTWFHEGKNSCPLCKTEGVNPIIQKKETMEEWRARMFPATNSARLEAAAREAAAREAAAREAAAREASFRTTFANKFPNLYKIIQEEQYKLASEDGELFFYKEYGGGHGTSYKSDGIKRFEIFGR